MCVVSYDVVFLVTLCCSTSDVIQSFTAWQPSTESIGLCWDGRGSLVSRQALDLMAACVQMGSTNSGEKNLR